MNTRPSTTRRAIYSVKEFCEAHGISKTLFYKLLKSGSGPRIMKFGRRTLIRLEAADEWLSKREEDARLHAAQES